MILYDFPMSPNSQRVSIFIKSKGIEIETRTVDMMKMEEKSQEMLTKNPSGLIPFLEVNHQVITESIAICRYLEALYPTPKLFGRTELEIGQVESIRRKIEFEGFQMVSDALRNYTPFFKNRALPGKTDVPQIVELAKRGVKQTEEFITWMDQHLNGKKYMICESFSIADIDAYVTIQSAKLIKILADNKPNIQKWLTTIQSQPAFSKE